MLTLRPDQLQATEDLRQALRNGAKAPLFKNIMGCRYGTLTVVRFHHSSNGAYWLCLCDCGRECVSWGVGLRRGRIKSCGRSCPITKDQQRKSYNEYQRRYRALNRAAIRKNWKRHYDANRETINRRARENKTLDRIRSKRWREKHQKQRREVALAWAKRNRDYVTAIASFRRARQQLAMPKWVDKSAILNIYRAAKSQSLSVDHIIPLRNKLVCGLHVPWNLQLIERRLNLIKNNKFTPEVHSYA